MVLPFIMAMNLAAWAAYAAGWLAGGHTERFAVAVLVIHALVEILFRDWHVGGLDVGVAAGQLVLLPIFGWLALTSDRWWPLGATATLILILLVHVLTVATPLNYFSAASARVGLWTVLHLVILAGAAERWLAGEAPASRFARWGPRPGLAEGATP